MQRRAMTHTANRLTDEHRQLVSDTARATVAANPDADAVDCYRAVLRALHLADVDLRNAEVEQVMAIIITDATIVGAPRWAIDAYLADQRDEIAALIDDALDEAVPAAAVAIVDENLEYDAGLDFDGYSDDRRTAYVAIEHPETGRRYSATGVDVEQARRYAAFYLTEVAA